jgi:hypothetical protein
VQLQRRVIPAAFNKILFCAMKFSAGAIKYKIEAASK